jgi:hypothetical protein
MDQESPFLRFWGQTVRWLAGRGEPVDPAASLLATTDKAYCEPESPISISAMVRDDGGEGTEKAQVSARITGPDKKAASLALPVLPGPAGNYRAVFVPATSGRYQVAVTARLGEKELSAPALEVEVGRPSLEFERLDIDEKLLEAIAAQTGGRYAHISTADRLIGELDRSLKRRRVAWELPLAWPPLLWAVFVGVLSLEWILRRGFQLR